MRLVMVLHEEITSVDMFGVASLKLDPDREWIVHPENSSCVNETDL